MKTYMVDGLAIKESSWGRSGYYGATYSPIWTQNTNMPFIAMVGNPKEPHLQKYLTAKLRQSLHLGRFSDAREAAFVVAMYKDDPETVLREIYEKRFEPVFPKELYTLPVYITPEQIEEDINNHIQYKNTNKHKKLSKEEVLKIARTMVQVRNVDAVKHIRKELEIGFMNRRYKTPDDVQSHVSEIIQGKQ